MRFSLARETQKLPFSPSDWFVIAVLGVIAIFAFGWFLGALSLRFTTEVPARGGTYTEGIVGTPRFMNPILAISDADRDMVQLIFAGLLREAPDGSLLPDIASGYTVSDDKKTYTFTIRDNAVFEDGTPITAEDVAYTISLAQNPAVKSPKRANWEGVMITIVDPHTISFTLKDQYAPFLENATLGILPKHLWSQVSVDEVPFSKLNVNPVGEGPYRVDSVITSSSGVPSQVKLVANTRAAVVPYITHMNFTFYDSVDTLKVAAEHDASLAAHSIPPDTASATHKVNEAILGRIFGVFFNQNQNPLFANKAIRTALDTALDKKALISTLISGYGSPIGGPLPPDTVTATSSDDLTADERLQAAAAILAKDGWVKASDGVYTKTVKKAVTRLSFTLATGNAPELKGAAEIVAATWKSLGVDVTTQFFEQNDLQQTIIRPRKFDALLFGEVIGRDLDLFAFWHSSQRNDPGLNIAGYVNTAVDKLLTDARTTDDLGARHDKAEAAAEDIQNDVAAVFLYAPHFVYLTPKNLSGLTLGTIATPSDRFSNVTDWYLATERVWPFFAHKN